MKATHQTADLNNKEFGLWKVIERGPNKEYTQGSKAAWICECTCGVRKNVLAASLIRGRSLSCGCISRQLTGQKLWTGYEEISGCYLARIKSGARVRGLEYDLSNEYIWSLFLKQNRKCAITGRDINFSRNNGRCRGKSNQTASLDRIDPSIGYIKDNVWWIHKDINIIKWDWTMEELYSLCQEILDNKHTTEQ
jgi:hypothetical protein